MYCPIKSMMYTGITFHWALILKPVDTFSNCYSQTLLVCQNGNLLPKPQGVGIKGIFNSGSILPEPSVLTRRHVRYEKFVAPAHNLCLYSGDCPSAVANFCQQ